MHLSAKLINLDYDIYRETESITSEKAVNLKMMLSSVCPHYVILQMTVNTSIE